MRSKLTLAYIVLSVSTALAYLVGDSCNPGNLLKNDGPCKNITLTCDDSANRCALRGCRIDEEIYDWPSEIQLPPMCNSTEYCPDNQLGCLPKVKSNEICSVSRDDSCEGENSICLNQRCLSKNIQLGQTCIIDNTSAYLVNRDNCLKGYFCSTNSNLCVIALENKEPCFEDRQCRSGTCKSNICQDEVEYNHFPVWGYVVIVVGCVLVIGLCILFVYIRRRRRVNAYKQSMAELESYRQSIITNMSPTPSHESTEQFKNSH
ncbi:hypothetical protein K493DRAFT_311154 [Basidiobolus meristosporus CBS 931.73]|uniref:EB domain-containing protein n=1 Tax=Basidiobolus meristosporus CBS 931.73 TaxID=1314790 RepID=A0A1Y1Z447_9FUNG|nr:hypothetical protein K493DRAFT_311154 [Basidiobolus meristosporus CBS 931.73]|eukprot:ORY05019.1 hypothetical protein K493DRAFT_311154 [Basidiobolus meristosporus CBS 931.73]